MNKKIQSGKPVDRVGEAYAQVYGWKLDKDNKMLPPYKSYPLPDYVEERVEWVSKELQRETGLTFRGAFYQLLEIDDEKKLKEEWELGAVSDYLPVTGEYRKWLKDPILHDIRRVAVMVAFIYR